MSKVLVTHLIIHCSAGFRASQLLVNKDSGARRPAPTIHGEKLVPKTLHTLSAIFTCVFALVLLK